MRMNHRKYADILMDHYLKPGDTAADLTLGNGYDMRKILDRIGETGLFYGFDISVESISVCNNILRMSYPNHQAKLYNTSHAQTHLIQKPLAFAIYNLGYLPGSDKSETTHPETTIQSILSILSCLSYDGIILLTVYSTHDAHTESNAVRAALQSLQHVVMTEHHMYPIKEEAPRVYTIQRTNR